MRSFGSLLRTAALVSGVLLCSTTALLAQATTGEIHGTVQDPQQAVVPGAKISLTNVGESAVVRQVESQSDGNFLLTPVLPGTYSLTIEAPGFKKYIQNNIVLNVNDKLGLPTITLEVGQANEAVSVEASAVALETVSAERSGLVNNTQMVELPLNGRNFTSLLATIPGAAGGFGANANFNGQSNFQNNYSVDGQTVTDIGVNQQFAYRINIDAIAELKVSTNSQAAEFGRASGAQIQTVTRSGTKDFHGTGWWFKRGEFMNANDFIRNQSGLQRSIYRYMQAGFNIGGPVLLPGKLNKDRNKLFFFASNEWGRSNTPASLVQITVPSAQERLGNFSDAKNAAGVVQPVIDPLTHAQFPGNIIPQSRWSQYGPQVLDWLPLPNVSGNPAYNYQSQVPAQAPTYDQVYRGDYNINDNWRLYGRAIISKSTQNNPYGRADSGNLLGLSPLYAPTFGWALNFDIATVLSPTLTNDLLIGYAVNGIPGDAPPADSPYYRANSGITIPLLYPNADPSGLIPNFSFAGVPNPGGPTGPQYTSFMGLPYKNRDPVYDVTDNVTKVHGAHTFKFGIFFEYAIKTESPFKPINSTISFNTDSANPGDTNWPFANALLGNFDKYLQTSTYLAPNYPYQNVEWYGQDTWKVNSHLTLNYGLRMSLVYPFHDTHNLMSNFLPAAYNPSQAISYYQPALQNGQRVAQNPLTGQFLPVAYIGDIVPNSGTLYNGILLAGQGGMPQGLLKFRGVQWGPRFGLAYNVGKTVLRMGGGIFYDRVTTFEVGTTSNYVTNPPTLTQGQILYGNLATIPTASTVNVPAAITGMSPDGHVPTVYNYSVGIQRELPFSTLLDVSYVGSQSRHLPEQDPFNYAPFGSAWLPQNQDPTVGPPQFNGNTTLPVQLYRPYAGYTSGSYYTFGSSSNYNALQVSANHRVGRGLTLGVAYSWQKALGIPGASSGTPGVGSLIDTREFNYGPLGFDQTQTLVINYVYNFPTLPRAGFTKNAVVRSVLNGWQLGGLVNIASGQPVNITYVSSLNGANISAATLNRNITGSEDVSPRVVMTCNPNQSMGDRNLNSYINTSCFAPASVGSVADDSGINRVRGPGQNQWDMSVYKKINITERAYAQLRLEAFNALNHPQFASFNSAITFNGAGQVINLPSQLGGTGGRFGFGALNATRANSNRILQIAAKFYF